MYIRIKGAENSGIFNDKVWQEYVDGIYKDKVCQACFDGTFKDKVCQAYFDGTCKDKVCQEYLMVLIRRRYYFNSIYKDSCREYLDGRCWMGLAHYIIYW
jgi:hypothetical protein